MIFKTFIIIVLMINNVYGAKPTDFYKDTSTVIRNAKPTDMYKDTSTVIRKLLRSISR